MRKYSLILGALKYLTKMPSALSALKIVSASTLLCFANTSIDYLVIEDFVIDRKENSFTLIKILNKNMRTVRNTVDGVRYTFI